MINSDEILSDEVIIIIGLITKIGERCGKQAVVRDALSNVMCHRVCVFISLSMPIKNT